MNLPKYSLLLKNKREKKLLTQDELASLVGLSGKRVISLYERGVRKPSMRTCKALAKVLGGKPSDYRIV